MQFVAPAIILLGKLWAPLKRQLYYLKNPQEKVQDLQKERNELTALASDVKTRVDGERLKLRNPQEKINYWLGAVEEVKQRANLVETQFQEDKRCLKGCLPNYYSRRKLAKETLKLIKEINGLKGKGSSFDDVALDPPPMATLMARAESFMGNAADTAFKRIRDCLKDEKIASIGVHGMGGIGKTTILKNVKNYFQNQKEMISFSMIVFVTVSQSPVLKSIQRNIAEQIGLSEPKGQSEENLSTRLHEALQRRKRLLIILDDLWDRLPLEEVGIPKPNADCKLVLVSRSLSVCQKMEADENIEVKALSSEDAWSLFREKARLDIMVHDSEIEDVAKNVAKECGGLPLALVTVGLALRNVNNVGVWRNALNQLRSSTSDIEDMEEKVFKRLKFSFDCLRRTIKECFLYCSLFPEDYKIKVNVLIDHWIWNGLIVQMENKQAEVDNGRSLLSELSRASMLEYDDDSDTVMMHDLMRDMSIRTTKHKPRFMVKAGMRLDKPLADHEWLEDAERISFMHNKIEKISGQPRCPRLQTLLLNNNYPLKVIPQSFFKNMCNLRVLDLSGTNIKALPESLSNLDKLRVLLLIRCWSLCNIPSLANLKELRVLHLTESKVVKEMPESLICLENLLELHLGGCSSLNRLPAFANLRKLRSLDLRDTAIEELPEYFFDLENLTNLNISSCYKLKTMPSLANLKKMEDLNLSYSNLEELPESLSDLENLHSLSLKGCRNLEKVPSLANLKKMKDLDLSDTNIKELPESLSDLKNLHALSLKGCRYLEKVPSLRKLQQLRYLSLASTSIEELPEGMERLVALETLHLDDTKRLRRFPIGILPKLSLLKDFSTCGSSCLWSSEMAETKEGRIGITEIIGLTRLTRALFDCGDLSSFSYLTKSLQINWLELRVVKSNNQSNSRNFEHNTIVLRRQRDVTRANDINAIEIRELHDMICLSEFLSDLGLMEFLRYVISSCGGVQFLLLGRDNNCTLLPNAIDLRISRLLNLESLHTGTIMQGTLASLRDIQVFACPKLKNLFPLRLFLSLQRLESILVGNCDMLEELVEGEDVNIGEHITLPNFQRLETLASLTNINVFGCPKLRYLLPHWLLQSLKSLESIDMKGCYIMEELVAREDVNIGEHITLPNFQRLEALTSLTNINVLGCPKLRYLLPHWLLQSLKSLKHISVKGCDIMEELLVREDVNTGEHITLPNFQRLETLASLTEINVSDCPKLQYLLPHWLLQSLKSLKSISVKGCDILEELVAGEDADVGEHVALPKFERLKLVRLKALKSICSRLIKCDSVKKIVVKQCPHLKKIPLCIDRLPRNFSGSFKGKKEWWDALDWDDPTNTRLLLQPFFQDEEASQEKESIRNAQKNPKKKFPKKAAVKELKAMQEQ